MDTLRDPTPRRPLSAVRSAVLATGVLGLLGVVSLATRADGRGPAPGGGVAAALGRHAVAWVVLVVVPILLVTGAAVLLYAQLLRRRMDTAMAALRRRLRRRTLVAVAIMLAVVVRWAPAGHNPFAFLHIHRPSLGGGGAAGHGSGHAHAGGVSSLDLGLAALTWAALVVAAVIGIRRFRGRSQVVEDEAPAADAEAAADLDLERLRAERDPRRAVIAAYAAMERVMASRSLGRGRAEAPLEYARRLVSQRAPGAADARRLTGLYLGARFGEHPVSERHRTEALAAVAALATAGEAPP